MTDPVERATGPWQRTGAVASLALGGFGLALLGLLAGRADLAVLGVPLILALASSAWQRPATTGQVAIEGIGQDPEGGRVRADLVLRPDPGSEVAVLRVRSPSHRRVDVVVDPRRAGPVPLSVSGVRTGRQRFFLVVHQEASIGHLMRSEARRLGPVELTVLPQPQALARLPLPTRLQGLTGAHGSRRVGEGGDLHDIAPFAAGDRLRRIDWRATLRESGRGRSAGLATDLHVRRTFATADAVVTLVLDSRDDIGRDPESWSGYGEVHPDDPTSLDIARQAAASIAKAYLEAGDRVGYVDLAREDRPVRPAGGQRHLVRIVHAIAESTPAGEARPIVRPPQVPSGALLVVLSTFLDDQVADLAATWVRHGHRVLAIDVLPPVPAVPRTLAERNLQRLVEVERADRLWELERAGVETVPWSSSTSGARSLTVGLAMLARQRQRQRTGR